MERSHSRERQETGFVPARLSVKEPDGIHNTFGIEFSAIDERQKTAYEIAIMEIADEEKLRPFHQGGSHNPKGWQYFEFWANTNKESVTDLFKKIHQKAKEQYEYLK